MNNFIYLVIVFCIISCKAKKDNQVIYQIIFYETFSQNARVEIDSSQIKIFELPANNSSNTYIYSHYDLSNDTSVFIENIEFDSYKELVNKLNNKSSYYLDSLSKHLIKYDNKIKNIGEPPEFIDSMIVIMTKTNKKRYSLLRHKTRARDYQILVEDAKGKNRFAVKNDGCDGFYFDVFSIDKDSEPEVILFGEGYIANYNYTNIQIYKLKIDSVSN